MFNTSVYFNNFDLSTLPGVKIVNYNISDLPSRNLATSKLARANRSVLTSAEYATKTVSISGFVGGDTWLERQDNYDTLKGAVQDVEGVLRFTQGTKTIEYTGTLNSTSRSDLGPNIAFTFEFVCSNPIGRDATGSQLFAPVTITTASLNIAFTVGGSFQAEPRITIVVGAVTGGTNKSISLLNAATGKGIKITRTWNVSDTVYINSDTFEVIVNNQAVDFSGQFPTFMPGPRTLQYLDDFTTRTVNLSGLYTRRYA